MDQKVQVGIIMGSRSDWDTMRAAAETLQALGIVHETCVVSAHRTPDLPAVCRSSSPVLVVLPICRAWWPPKPWCQC
jgi:phosphoribosylcarboxyaminoimidazole (NCAIR) mutase